MNDAQRQFLMSGDPAIRWQTMRDLLDGPEAEWKPEREKVAFEGWGAKFLAYQNEDGNWPRERWTDNVWTMLTLVDLGMPAGKAQLERGFDQIVSRWAPMDRPVDKEKLFRTVDLCHIGFWVRIGGSYCPRDPRLPDLVGLLLERQMGDGGWNCRIRRVPKTTHSSFHTTFNVLEGLRQAVQAGILDKELFRCYEEKAIEFCLEHQLYRSDKTGKIISQRFLDLTYPSHWHYNVLRGLDYLRQTSAIKDPRLNDPLEWLWSRKKTDHFWPVEKRIPGVTLFNMETLGRSSRWNTLRALRVLAEVGS